MAERMVPVGRLQVATPASVALSIRQATEAQVAVDDRVRPIAAEIITSDSTIVAATAESVGRAVEGLDLVTGGEIGRLVVGVEGAPAGKSFQMRDAVGNPLWVSANDVDGGPDRDAADAIARAATAPVAEPGVGVTVTADGNRTVLETNDTNGGFSKDAADLVRLTVPTSRALVNPRVRAKRGMYARTRSGVRRLVADPARIVVHGESHAARPWTDNLATLTGGTVTNRAIGGMSGDMVALRQGGMVVAFAVAGGAIPPSGPVNLTKVTDITWRINVAFTMPAIAVADDGTEIPGELSRAASGTDNGTWVFTRTTAGSTVPTTRVMVRSTDLDTYSEHLPIVLFGRNDWELIVNGVGVPGGDPVSSAITATAAIVESLLPVVPRVLLLGTINDTAYVRGTAGHAFVTEYLAELWRCWPDFALPPGETLRDYIASTKVLTDAGLTPTAADTANILNDAPPPQIMADALHWAPAADPGVASFVNAALTQKGWL